MLRRDSSAFFVLGLSALLAVACQPKIGDSCTTSTNCSATGDRLCDITEPGGYCTIFNCEPGSCPEEAACINFGTEISPVSGCATGDGTSPYQRAFCLFRCSSDSDCRAGYACVDLAQPNRFNAEVAEYSGGTKVCIVRDNSTAPTVADGGSNLGVCLGAGGGPDGGLSAGGAASSGGTGGAGGMSGGSEAGSGGNNAGAGG